MDDATRRLIEAGWTATVAQRIVDALEPRPALVALDFDNTLIVGDTGETLHYVMCEHFAYALETDEFWQAIPEEIGRNTLRERWQAAESGASDQTQRLRDSGFDVELVALFARYFTSFGARATFDWAATMFAGLKPEQLRRFVGEAFDRELLEPIGVREASTADGITLRMNRGIRTCDAASAMIREFQSANADLWIVSATNRWTLEAIAPKLGLRDDRILANGCHVRDGRITAERDGATTWYKGKVIAWNDRFDRPPDIVVGDSYSDAPLMRLAARLAVLIDRGDTKLRAEADERGWAVVTREQLGRPR